MCPTLRFQQDVHSRLILHFDQKKDFGRCRKDRIKDQSFEIWYVDPILTREIIIYIYICQK